MNRATSASRTAASVCWRIRPGSAVRVLVLEPGGVDHPELEPEQARLALAAVAGHAGPVVDQRQPLADQPVEQGRFADVGPADDGDGGERHGGD